MSLIGKELFKSLAKRYQSEIQSNRTSMLIYFKNPLIINSNIFIIPKESINLKLNYIVINFYYTNCQNCN